MRKHRVSIDVLRSLAAGGADETGTLRGGQVSRRRLLLSAVQRRLAADHPDLFVAGAFAANWSTLAAALRAAPEAVERVLLYPSVGAWGMRLLQRLQETTALTEPDVDDAGYFGGVIAAALVRAGLAGQVRVRARANGTVSLPGLGRFDSPVRSRWLTAEVRTDPASVRLLDANPLWLSTRRLRSTSAGQRLEVLLDDLDPFRAPDRLPADDRLKDEAIDRWQQHIDSAWTVLVQRHPRRAAALSRDVTVLTPLRATEGEPDVSASAGESFGGVALTDPTDGTRLAEALLHEHQHIKLWALLSLVPLVDMLDDRLHYAPWRTDPRPARGLLQGAYAYLGLVEFWETERYQRNGAASRIAHYEFARWRTAVRDVLETLDRSGALTDAGHKFVAGMKRTLAPLLTAPVPTLPAELADEANAENRIGWLLRNVRSDPDVLRTLALAWHEGLPCPPTTVALRVLHADRRGHRPSDRQRLSRELLTVGAGPPAAVLPHSDELHPADIAFLQGDDAAAAALYAETICSATAPLDAWVGLALAHRRLRSPAGIALTDRPELVRALWETIGPDEAAPPRELATWLGAGLHPRGFDH